jgi:hypothetical protein
VELKDNPKLKIELQLRAEIEGRGIRSISYMDTVTINDKDDVYEALNKALMERYFDAYNQESFKNLIMVYVIRPESYKRNISTATVLEKFNKKGLVHIFSGNKLPSTMDFKK